MRTKLMKAALFMILFVAAVKPANTQNCGPAQSCEYPGVNGMAKLPTNIEYMVEWKGSTYSVYHTGPTIEVPVVFTAKIDKC